MGIGSTLLQAEYVAAPRGGDHSHGLCALTALRYAQPITGPSRAETALHSTSGNFSDRRGQLLLMRFGAGVEGVGCVCATERVQLRPALSCSYIALPLAVTLFVLVR